VVFLNTCGSVIENSKNNEKNNAAKTKSRAEHGLGGQGQHQG
jgi:hypothetical protein